MSEGQPGETMSDAPRADLRLSGSPTGEEPGWTDARVKAWIGLFLALGVALRLLRFGLRFPLWRDEAFLAANIYERDFADLARPLDYQQVCPVLFLWAEKALTRALGFGEWSLRLLPTAAAIASLFLFRHVAGRLLKGVAPAIAVAFLAVGYAPLRYGGEVKPYATDFLAALGLIALAVEWLRARDRTASLWGLAALGPLAVASSNPSIFIAASAGLALAVPVLKTRSPRAIVPFALFGAGTVATFLALLVWVNVYQSERVMSWMRVAWAGAFPPREPGALIRWLARVHTSQAFAYPAGGESGASALTTALVVLGIVVYLRRGPKTVLALLLVPFALGLAAAALGRYPYGGSSRTMQYVAPSILLLAGLGAAALLARLPRPTCRDRSPSWVLMALAAVGIGQAAWDVARPYKDPMDQDARAFARRFWAEESAGADTLCARTDLHLPLGAFARQGDRAAFYLCHQATYSPRHHAGVSARLDLMSEAHPLRLVVFGETPGDAPTVARWIDENADRYALSSRRERVLNEGLTRGKATAEDRYVVYEFVPRRGPATTRVSSP
jgi:hypothetical protein